MSVILLAPMLIGTKLEINLKQLIPVLEHQHFLTFSSADMHIGQNYMPY